MSDSACLPTGLWVDAVLAQVTAAGQYYYIPNRGDHSTGLILLKLSDTKGMCKLLTQQRNFDGDLIWMNALDKDTVTENDADSYIQRSIQRDPDLWVIEIEAPEMNNPFA